jgi:hypothetical protein
MMKKIVRIFILFFVLVLSYGSMSCGSTTSSSAAPQASIPLPSNDDPITVSSPNSEGFVTITASIAAVPNDSIVVIEVTDAIETSFLDSNLEDLSKQLFAAAYAQTTCTSALPQCPELSADQCQVTANADGSFTTQVPATADQGVVVSYLDVDNSCSETQAYGANVNSNILALDFEVTDYAYDEDDAFIYLLTEEGTTNPEDESTTNLVVYDIAGNSLVYMDFEGAGELSRVELVSDHNATQYLVIESNPNLYIGEVVPSSDGATIAYEPKLILDEDGATLGDASFLGMESFTYGDSDTCVSASLFDSTSTEDMIYTRALFHSNESGSSVIHVLEFVDDLSDVDTSYVNNDGNFILRDLSLDFGTFSNVSSFDSTTSTRQVYRMEFATGYVYSLVSVEDSSTGDKVFALAQKERSDDYCSDTFTFSSSETTMVHLGTVDTSAYDYNFYDSTAGGDAFTFSFVNRSDKSFSMLHVSDDAGLTCLTDGEVVLEDGTADDDNECSSIYDSSAGWGFDFSEASIESLNSVYIFSDSTAASTEAFLMGYKHAGSAFFAADGGESSLKPDDQLSVINPLGISYDETEHRFIVIDSGNDSDTSSNIVFYDLLGSI